MQTRSLISAIAPSSPLTIAALAERLNQWRRSRHRGKRIPEELWSAAVSLARIHGLSPMATALKLNYQNLQARMAGPRPTSRPAATAPTFLELPALKTVLPEPGTVELTHPNGSRLTLRLPSAGVGDLLPLVHAFLRP